MSILLMKAMSPWELNLRRRAATSTLVYPDGGGFRTCDACGATTNGPNEVLDHDPNCPGICPACGRTEGHENGCSFA